MPIFGDEEGLFWDTPPKIRLKKEIRTLPAIPDTSWIMPNDFPCLRGQGIIAIDIETYDPDLLEKGPGAQRGGYIAGVAVGTEAGFRAYYPIQHAMGANLPREQVLDWLSAQLTLPVPKLGANILYDLDFLTTAGVKVVGPFYDVQVAEPLIDENRLTYALESLAQKYLDRGKEETVMLAWLHKAFGNDEENIKGNIWRAPASIVGPYAEADVDLPLKIFIKQKRELESLKLWDLFLLESKLIPLLLAMRQRGVRVNLARAEEMYDSLTKQQASITEKITQLTGFNDVDLWAAQSLAGIFDKLNIQYPRTPKTGAPSFRREWLEQHTHPITNLIRDARKYDKLRETFVKGYIMDGHINGRIHCQFHQLRTDKNGTVSGRFSSSHPNLQNIPVRDETGKLIRSIFIPEEGQTWWKFDWSQIEYRLIAHYAASVRIAGNNLAGAADVVDRYQNDPDVDYHQLIADLTGLSRYNAKTLNFGLAYGQGVWLLCHNLGVEYEEGERIIREYHERAPFIRPLLRIAMKRVEQEGYLTTLLGRHRRFNLWERSHWDPLKRKKETMYFASYTPGAKRAFTHKALNALIQGSAADIMKLAMVKIWESGVCDVLGAPHLTVHDELCGSFEENAKPAKEALDTVKDLMQTCVRLLVPLRADGSVGLSWGQVGEAQAALL